MVSQQEEVDRNYEAFKELLDDLLGTDADRFALMHNAKLIACFDTLRDARKAGKEFLDGKPFSVQEITKENVNLGYFSYAGILRAV